MNGTDKSDAKTLLDDAKIGEQAGSDDDGSMEVPSSDEGEDINDEGGDTPGDEDTGDDDAGDDDGGDDGGGDQSE